MKTITKARVPFQNRTQSNVYEKEREREKETKKKGQASSNAIEWLRCNINRFQWLFNGLVDLGPISDQNETASMLHSLLHIIT